MIEKDLLEKLNDRQTEDPMFLQKIGTAVGAIVGLIVGILVVKYTEEIEESYPESEEEDAKG